MTSRPIPEAALTQHAAIMGMTGMGKSYAGRTVIEGLLDQGRRVCILDYTGVWYGLRSSADGKGKGFPAVIFGGEHGDVALNDAAGPAVARFVAGGDQTTIIDLDGMTVGAQQRFITSFCEELYRTNKRALHIVFEECDELCPQTGAPGSERMIGAVARIFQRGRKKGFRAIAITQRPANLHKRVLAQCKTMVALKLVAPQDRKAIAEWVRGHGDEDEGKRIVQTLPRLARGEGWVWAPEQGVLERVRFPAIRTFDSMRAPEDGENHEPVTWASINLDALRKEMESLVEEAKANDPAALKEEITTLRRQMQEAAAAASRAGNPPDPAAIVDAEARGIETGKTTALRALGKFAADLAGGVGRAATACDQAKVACDDAQRLLDSYATFIQTQADAAPAPRPVARPAPQPVRQTEPKRQPAARANGDSSLSGPQRTFLQALAWWRAMGHDRPSRVQVASIAGWRVTSGHLKNVAGSLRTQGLIDYPGEGCISLTAAGVAAAPEPDTSASLEDSVVSILTGPQRQAFAALPKRGGAITREDLASRCGWEITSGHVKNVLGSMRSLEIIEYPAQGSVARAEWLRQ